MKERTETLRTYQFEELSGEAQDKALEEMYDANIWHDWHEIVLDEAAQDWREKYGITFNPGKTYFDIDRDNYLYFHDGLEIEDSAKLLRAISGNAGYGLAAHNGLLEPYSENTHYGGGRARTHLRLQDNRDSTTRDLPFDADEWLYDLTQELLSRLSKEYDYLTSREAIIETIEANEYEFYEDGSRSRCIIA